MHDRLFLLFLALAACDGGNEVDAGGDPVDAGMDAGGGEGDAGNDGAVSDGGGDGGRGDGGRDAGLPPGVSECTGTVVALMYNTPEDPFDGEIGFGTTVTLRISVDLAAVDDDSRATRGEFDPLSVPPTGIVTRTGRWTFGPEPTSECWACTANDDAAAAPGFGRCDAPGSANEGPFYDNLEIVCLWGIASPGGVGIVTESYIVLRDNGMAWRDSDSLPTTEIGDFDFSGDVTTEFGVYGNVTTAPVGEDQWFFYGTIDSCR